MLHQYLFASNLFRKSSVFDLHIKQRLLYRYKPKLNSPYNIQDTPTIPDFTEIYLIVSEIQDTEGKIQPPLYAIILCM